MIAAPIRVAVVGTRGIPNVHGGVERHCEELYPRLVELGVSVEIFGRDAYVSDGLTYRGVNVRSVRAFRGAGSEALSHTLLSILVARPRDFDVLHIHSVGPGALVPFAHARGHAKVVLTVHAPDYLQKKWGYAARSYLAMGERVGVRSADAVISVAEWMRRSIWERHGVSPKAIPNGPGLANIQPDLGLLGPLGLTAGRYVLFVGRLIPDKRVEDLIAAMRTAHTDLPLVVVGGAADTASYAAELRRQTSDRVVFLGFRYGRELAALYAGASVFVLPSAVEGLPVSLLEAMQFSTPVIVSDIAANREVVGSKAGLVFPLGDVRALSAAIASVVNDPALAGSLGSRGKARVASAYDWDSIARRTHDLYCSLLGRESSCLLEQSLPAAETA